ncbi:hypothetical protein WMY93_031483, partial [Mugilogobius chulae]
MELSVSLHSVSEECEFGSVGDKDALSDLERTELGLKMFPRLTYTDMETTWTFLTPDNSPSLCTLRDLPLTLQSCVLSRDCQLSEWSQWSSCSTSCSDPASPRGTRTRSRQVTQLSVGEGVQCEPVEETERCEPGGDGAPPCPAYTWRTSEWSECRVDLLLSQQDRRRGNLTGLCGGGLQTREVYCVQANAELLTYISQMQDKGK